MSILLCQTYYCIGRYLLLKINFCLLKIFKILLNQVPTIKLFNSLKIPNSIKIFILAHSINCFNFTMEIFVRIPNYF